MEFSAVSKKFLLRNSVRVTFSIGIKCITIVYDSPDPFGRIFATPKATHRFAIYSRFRLNLYSVTP